MPLLSTIASHQIHPWGIRFQWIGQFKPVLNWNRFSVPFPYLWTYALTFYFSCRTLCSMLHGWGSTSASWHYAWATTSFTWGGGSQIPSRSSRWRLRPERRSTRNRWRGVNMHSYTHSLTCTNPESYKKWEDVREIIITGAMGGDTEHTCRSGRRWN